MQLLDWQAIAIAGCPDNIHAKTIACEQATLLAAEWYAKLAPEDGLSVVIQGDILPLIQYLNYNARLRYAGIQQHLISIKQTALHQLPNHTRQCHLAGQGSDMLSGTRHRHPHQHPTACDPPQENRRVPCTTATKPYTD